MAWRNQGITGSNNIPLGSRRRFGGDDSPGPTADGGYAPSRSNDVYNDAKRGRSPERVEPERTEPERNPDGTKRRKKRNRWGDASDNKAAGLMNLPTAITGAMTTEQLEAYTLHVRIEEISQKLRINDVVPADGDRSISPQPMYDNHGRRINTREYRYRKRLEEERHKLVEKAMKVIPSYHPPPDYKRPNKTQEKVYVPVNDYPEINFIGLLIGPRGNTLKKMETESQAKIAIRGKGSVKEGKGRSDAAHSSNQEEDLHCLIMADTEEKVNKAKRLIHNVIETAASIPEGQNELKRNQLRELAALNGTLRDDENQACQNCGEIGHRKYDCPSARNYTANIICRVCGNAGHMARDCPDRQRGTDWRNGPPPAAAVQGRAGQGRIGTGDMTEQEYDSLMAELGGEAPAGNGAAPAKIEAGPDDQENGNGENRDIKPWQRGPTGAPAPWLQNRAEQAASGPPGGSGAPPPWLNRQRDNNEYGGGYNGGQSGNYGRDGGGAPPWQQEQQQAPPSRAPAPWLQSQPQHSAGGYGAYPAPSFEQGYNGAPGYSGAPGYNGAPGYSGPPGYNQYGGDYSSVPPPPPPSDLPPPPPPDFDDPPPPPPPA